MLQNIVSLKSGCLIPVCLLIIVFNAGLYYKLKKEILLKRLNHGVSTRLSTKPNRGNVTARLQAAAEDNAKMKLQDISLGNLTAYKQLGYAGMKLMEVNSELRPLFDFKLTPWKISAEVSRVISSNIIDRHVNWSMIVLVKSNSKNQIRRKLVRNSWGSFKYLNGVRLEVVFVVAKGKDASNKLDLLRENEEHGDLLQIDIDEVYKDVGLKTLAGMQWVSQNFPSHWIYSSADDDMVPLLGQLYSNIEKMMKTKWLDISKQHTSSDVEINMFHSSVLANLPIHCGYHLTPAPRPMRGICKWCVDKTTYSLEKYPSYCHGGWYSMPVKLASGIYDISRRHTFYRLDDVWITALLRLSYFSWLNQDYFGCKPSDQYIGIWRNGTQFVKHAYNEKGVEKLWKSVETKILQSSREYIKI